MSNLAYNSTATLSVSGITPASGPTFSLKINASYAANAVTADDALEETYTVNANTTATPLDLGKIVSGDALWIQVDGPLMVTVTQVSGAATLHVSDFLYLSSDYLSVSIANPSLTTAVHMSIVAVGNRAAVGGGPGIF